MVLMKIRKEERLEQQTSVLSNYCRQGHSTCDCTATFGSFSIWDNNGAYKPFRVFRSGLRLVGSNSLSIDSHSQD